MSFVHLHVHSQYSLLEATCRTKELAKRTAKLQMPGVALTDNGNLFGAVEFYFACQDAGVKPILGTEVYLAPKGRLVKGDDKEAARLPNRRLVLLAQNFQGYQNLCKLSSIGFQEGFYYKPRVDEEVLKLYTENVICLTGGIKGLIPSLFVDFGPEKALDKIRDLKALFGDRLYLEINRTGLPAWSGINDFLFEASRSEKVPLVAANDVHYLDRDDSLAQEVLICIGTNKTLQDDTRLRLGSQEFHFKGPEEMRSLFHDIPEACDSTLEIAERCQVKFKLKDESGKPIYHLPSFPTQNGVSTKDEMRRLSEAGLVERFEEAAKRGETVAEEQKPTYHSRLKFELEIIDRMGFNGYFLIVQDFINWAKSQSIPVGPGRGSGAGSLVAYCLKITDLDPMRYSLIFERFLNPERISMPDFDVDFCQDRRGEVIEYVTQKYGSACVSQIITYGKLQTRLAIRDVGRVLGMTFGEVDAIAKLVPEKLGITLTEAIDTEPRLRELMEEEPKIATLMDLAKRIEGLTRQAGIHAAGVVISDKPLVEHAPLYKGEHGENVVQYDMKMSEKIGLIKFDFLGLKTLTHIHNALKLIESNRNKKFTTQDISLSDKGIYELMSRGDTAGVFQFEGDGISDLIKRVRPTCFEDITAINALYRPGPMQMLDEYIGRKHGEIKVQYAFPQLEEVLKETYGIIVYQEQVQLIAAKIANYTLGEADMLRRAMGKKIAEEMAQQRSRFMQGAKANGHDEKKAGELFDLMEKFAEYGFNKSHAAAYCVVAAHTAWLKAYYPVEFYAALLSTEMSDTDKVVKYVKDARTHGIEVQGPHVNSSEYKFSVKGDAIIFGMGAIKGVGESAVDAILEARREKNKFETLEDFFASLDLRRVNKKVIECLIKGGALDGFGPSRSQLMAGYTQYIERAETRRDEAEVGQTSLFDLGGEESQNEVALPDVKPWSKSERLAHEKDVLGFYLSEHPLTGMEGIFKSWVNSDVAGLKNFTHKARVSVGGLVGPIKEFINKKGARMAFGSLEDLTGSVELVIFPEAYAKGEALLKSESPVIIEGAVDAADEKVPKILVDSVTLLDDRVRRAGQMVLRLDSTMQKDLPALQRLMVKFPGKTSVNFRIDLPEQTRTVLLSVTDPEGVNPSREFFEELHTLVGRTDFVEVQAYS